MDVVELHEWMETIEQHLSKRQLLIGKEILKEINSSLLQSFQNTISNLQDSRDIVNDKISDLIKQGIIKLTDKGFQLNIELIKKHNNTKAYLFKFLNEFGFTEWDDVVGLLEAQSGKQVFSEKWRLIKDRDYLLLSELVNEEQQTIIILKSDIQVQTPFGVLFFDEVNAILETSKNTIYVDKDALKYPLQLRKWQEGDVFYPLGMSGKKKLSKYFKDEKLSLLDKENTWLLCSENTIVWVVNRRADNRFRITENTKQILKIELK